MPDLELERLQRSVHLADYARASGYQPLARESTPGVTVLEHPLHHDRVAVARTRGGEWIFSSLPDYKPPPMAGEPADQTRERLRDCIARTRDKGSVVDFVQHCERVAGRPEPSPEQVRAHLVRWQEQQRAPDLEMRATVNDALNRRIYDWKPSPGLPDPSEAEVQQRIQRWNEAQRALDAQLASAADLARPDRDAVPERSRPSRDGETGLSAGCAGREVSGAVPPNPAKRDLSQRRYDWSPPVGGAALDLARTRRDAGPDRER